jgi:hypothetical protein
LRAASPASRRMWTRRFRRWPTSKRGTGPPLVDAQPFVCSTESYRRWPTSKKGSGRYCRTAFVCSTKSIRRWPISKRGSRRYCRTALVCSTKPYRRWPISKRGTGPPIGDAQPFVCSTKSYAWCAPSAAIDHMLTVVRLWACVSTAENRSTCDHRTTTNEGFPTEADFSICPPQIRIGVSQGREPERDVRKAARRAGATCACHHSPTDDEHRPHLTTSSYPRASRDECSSSSLEGRPSRPVTPTPCPTHALTLFCFIFHRAHGVLRRARAKSSYACQPRWIP